MTDCNNFGKMKEVPNWMTTKNAFLIQPVEEILSLVASLAPIQNSERTFYDASGPPCHFSPLSVSCAFDLRLAMH